MLISLFFMGCAVEVGNPNTDEQSTGTVKVNIATDEESSFALATTTQRKLEMNIESIQLYGYDADGEDIVADLQVVNSTVNFFDANPQIEVANDQAPPGFYEKIVITLKRDNPFYYFPQGGQEVAVNFENTEHRSFSLDEPFNLETDALEDLLVDLDLQNSLVSDKDRFVFKPHFKAFHKKRMFTHSGKLEKDDGETVCAYHYAPERRKFAPPPFRNKQPGKKFRHLPPLAEGKRRPVFKTLEEITLDESVPCLNAYAQAEVAADGTFEFPRLRPGSYKLRVFYKNGSFEDIRDHLTFMPPLPPPFGEGDRRRGLK